VRDERSVSNADDVTVIPSHHRVTQQLLSHWQTFRDLKLIFADSRRAEQLSLCSQQRIVATVEEIPVRRQVFKSWGQHCGDIEIPCEYDGSGAFGDGSPYRP
jgi:hypothetical protein